MEGTETFSYRFVKSLIQEDITYFRAKHVKNWLRRVKYDQQVYDAQVYNNIINPLLEKKFIRKGDIGYYLEENAKGRLESLRRHKSGPKQVENLTKIPTPFELDEKTLEEVSEVDPNQHVEGDKDEWDTYIAKKLKEDTQGKV